MRKEMTWAPDPALGWSDEDADFAYLLGLQAALEEVARAKAQRPLCRGKEVTVTLTPLPGMRLKTTVEWK